MSGSDPPAAAPGDAESPDIDDLLDHLEDMEATADTHEEREQVREAMRVARRVDTGGVFGRVIRGFDRGDLTEAMLGSLIFGVPMAVEDGTLAAGEFVATRPAFLAGTLLFTAWVVIGILYVADIQDVQVHRPLLGIVPRRLVGVLGVSFLMGILLFTAWGRIDWSDPWIAFSQVVVAYLPMAIGAALGDILPGS